MKFTLKKVDWHKIVHHFALGFDLLFVVFLLIIFFGNVADSWINILPYVIYFVVAINTFFFATKINKIPEAVRDKSGMIYYFSHFFLLTLVIVAINKFVKNQFIIDNMAYLTAISIAFGFLTFYAHRNKVEKEIEDGKITEERKEKKRFNEFDKKFKWLTFFNFQYGVKSNWKEKRYFVSILRALVSPFIWFAKIPYSLVRWMYKEGFLYSICFLLLLLLFFIIKIFFILKYPGNFPDEWFHIVSGLSFIDTSHFARITNAFTGPYLRGSYVSLFSAFLFTLFGKSLFVAKLVPAIMGVFNFFILYLISKKLSLNKILTLLLLLVYSLNPWIIFNHFYIRMYVFYEFFNLLLIYLSFILLDLLKRNKSSKDRAIWLVVFLIVLLNFVNYFLSYDFGKYVLLFSSFLIFGYIFIFKLNRLFPSLKLSKLNRTLILIISSILASIVFRVDEKINSLLFSATTTSADSLGFFTFFISLNSLFTILALVSLSYIFFKSDKFKIIGLIFFSLFSIHILSGKGLEIIRGILYFIPLYLLFAFLSLERIFTLLKRNFLKVFIFLILFLGILISISNNYPSDFLNIGPNIPGEVSYYEFSKTYEFMEEKIDEGYKIINLDYTLVPDKFFNVTTLFKVDFSGRLSRDIFNYYHEASGELRDISVETPIITTKEKFYDVLESEEKICFIFRKYSATHFLDEDTTEFINFNYELEAEFKGFKIYCNQ